MDVLILTLIFAVAAVVFAVVLAWDLLEHRARRRDRAIVRRLHTYLASLPPARPW